MQFVLLLKLVTGSFQNFLSIEIFEKKISEQILKTAKGILILHIIIKMKLKLDGRLIFVLILVWSNAKIFLSQQSLVLKSSS